MVNDGGLGSSLLGISLRQPPASIAAEQALLGALFSNNRTYELVADYLRPEHFADPIHTTIWQHAELRILEGRLADAITLKQDFENTGLLEEVGGTKYLAQLLTAMVGIINASEYGRTIHDAYLRRKLIEIGESIVNAAFGDSATDARAQLEVAERALGDLGSNGARRDRMMTVGEAVSAAIRQAEAVYKGGQSPAVMVGMKAVDDAFGGLWPGDFILLAGIPGAGKTALAVQIGFEIALRLHAAALGLGHSQDDALRQPGVAVFSLEMSAAELGARIAAFRAGISVERLRRGELDMDTATRLLKAEHECTNLPLRIHDCRATSLRLLAAKIRMHLRRQPEILIVVDHMLVLESDNAGRGKGSSGHDVATVAKASRDLKQLAGELQIPMLVLTHASRASSQRVDPRPSMGDVKWAGEGDADMVAFVHRPVMFMPDRPPPKGERESDEKYSKRRLVYMLDRERALELAELVIAKKRMGSTGIWRLRFDGPTTSFGEWGGYVES